MLAAENVFGKWWSLKEGEGIRLPSMSADLSQSQPVIGY